MSAMEEIVSRPQITVRRVTPDLQGDFTALCVTAQQEADGSSAVRDASEGRVARDERVAVALARPDVRAYLAVVDDEPVGYIMLSRRPLSFLTDSQCVSIEQIFVVREARRGGAARALVSAATTYADRLGAEQVASSVPSQGREANRFFARLGFSSYVVRRVTTTSALRRKLSAGDEPHPGFDQLLQRRRSLRAQATRSATLDQLLQRRRSLREQATRSFAPEPRS
jgi:GNAT superfamily N-acetyltransferase